MTTQDVEAGPTLSVAAVVVNDGSLLLIRRGRAPAAGSWSVPGGKVERGELLAAAVIRELREETGLEGVCDELLGWAERIEGDEHYVILDFRVTVLGHLQPVAGDDASEAAWVDLEEVPHLDLVSGLAEALHQWGVLDIIA